MTKSTLKAVERFKMMLVMIRDAADLWDKHIGRAAGQRAKSADTSVLPTGHGETS